MYSSTRRPDQRTQVCDSSRMAWNGGRGETEWPISPAGNPFLPREALQMLISKDLETLCLMPFFYLLHAVFLLDLLTLFHICYSNSGENLGKSSSVCLFCPNLAPKTDENFSQWWWCSLQDISTPNGGYIHHKIIDLVGRYIGDQDWISLQQVVILTQLWLQSH